MFFPPTGAALNKRSVSFEKSIISSEFWKCHTGYWLIGLAVSMTGASVELSLWSNFQSSQTLSLLAKASASGRTERAEVWVCVQEPAGRKAARVNDFVSWSACLISTYWKLQVSQLRGVEWLGVCFIFFNKQYWVMNKSKAGLINEKYQH